MQEIDTLQNGSKRTIFSSLEEASLEIKTRIENSPNLARQIRKLSSDECQKLVEDDKDKRVNYTIMHGWVIATNRKSEYLLVSNHNKLETAKSNMINRLLCNLGAVLHQQYNTRDWLHFHASPQQLKTLDAIATQIAGHRSSEPEFTRKAIAKAISKAYSEKIQEWEVLQWTGYSHIEEEKGTFLEYRCVNGKAYLVSIKALKDASS